MISKGKFRWLRERYRAIIIHKRMVANLAWQWEADTLTQPKLDPKMKEQLLEVFRKHFSGDRMKMLEDLILSETRKQVFHVDEPFVFHMAERPKGDYYTVRVGKHRQPPEEGEKVYGLHWDEKEFDQSWANYTKALSELNVEDMPLTKRYRIPKLNDERMREAGEYTKFAVAAALAARVSKRG